MGIKRAVATLLLTGATAATGTLAGAGTASAAEAVRWCDGTEVRTCITMWIDHNGSYHEVDGDALIVDDDGGRNFDIDATMVKVQMFDSGAWRDLGVKVERAWVTEFTNDSVDTRTVSCTGPGTKQIRAVGWYRYRRAGGDVVEYEQMATQGRQLACQR